MFYKRPCEILPASYEVAGSVSKRSVSFERQSMGKRLWPRKLEKPVAAPTPRAVHAARQRRRRHHRPGWAVVHVHPFGAVAAQVHLSHCPDIESCPDNKSCPYNPPRLRYVWKWGTLRFVHLSKLSRCRVNCTLVNSSDRLSCQINWQFVCSIGVNKSLCIGRLWPILHYCWCQVLFWRYLHA